jgi:hypothetical protein
MHRVLATARRMPLSLMGASALRLPSIVRQLLRPFCRSFSKPMTDLCCVHAWVRVSCTMCALPRYSLFAVQPLVRALPLRAAATSLSSGIRYAVASPRLTSESLFDVVRLLCAVL